MTIERRHQVYRYHDDTKHHVGRYARSLGYLDWSSQPRPFRSFAGAPQVRLFPDPAAAARPLDFAHPSYDRLFSGDADGSVITVEALGDFLRHALGLSAWKVFQRARWSLRVNPSSGNLHPTEAYLVTGVVDGLVESPAVWHYAVDRHLLERRCAFDASPWPVSLPAHGFLIALTSIHWRESWKYGERAFRYCQHDLGHAIAALGIAARLHGWRLTMVPEWSQRSIASLVGVDRADDYFEAEAEEPACLLMVTAAHRPLTAESGEPTAENRAPIALLEAVRRGQWFGKASQLSEDHVDWTFIDDVARASEDPGRVVVCAEPSRDYQPATLRSTAAPDDIPLGRPINARALLVQRRSAVALDGVSAIDRARFLAMLSRVMPRAVAPWTALWWPPRIHLALFVHRVVDVVPGLYVLARSPEALPRLRAALSHGFVWQPIDDGLPLWLLEAGDYRRRSKRVSCDQDIAADGFFSLGMIADFDESLSAEGPSFYRHLFWESGVIGQVLYLEAEAAHARATGIGCFFDDEVHQLLGLEGHTFQSLYHFTVGMPVEDTRLTTEPGYVWERKT